MRQIIKRKQYNTETARELGYDSYGSFNDFRNWCETLYRKQNGEYFLHGIGGPASKYAVSVGLSQWSGGEKIIPLTVNEAMTWAEEHLSADEYEGIFGEVAE